ncbi:hypothetical protein M3Y99_00496700 [Aphelenchoides fujianensis]|nr:hypothetical protein M3Y99_00496700 [Aphelenchoides fujianensis]
MAGGLRRHQASSSSILPKMSRFLQLACLLVLSAHVANARFTAGFHQKLVEMYGDAGAEQLERSDLGDAAAFGGGPSDSWLDIANDPVVLVHGNKRRADDEVPNAQFYEQKGFQNGSVFATTWGPNGTTMSQNQVLHCDYVKQIRNLIVAVQNYTGRYVLVGAQSLGSAVSRKAILGGPCVDTGDDLGPPLTSIVRIFFSLAGCNQGLGRCLTDADYKNAPLCTNTVNGAPPNNTSAYLKDINAHTKNSVFEMLTTNHLTNATLQKDVAAETQKTGQQCTGSVQQ